MPLALVCPSCKYQTVTTALDAREWGKCPRCSKRKLVPEIGSADDTEGMAKPAVEPKSDSAVAPSLAPGPRGSRSKTPAAAPEEVAVTAIFPAAPSRPGVSRSKAPASDEERVVLQEVARAQADPRSHFGRFTLLGELGKGGMGVVHRAWDDRLRRVVALKTLLNVGVADEASIQRFYREAETVARLRHPNIVSVFEVGEHEGKHYLAMDYIEGATLDRRMRPKPSPTADTLIGKPGKQSVAPNRLPLNKAVEIMRDVARAVHFAHENGVIHRDLKPQNVMLDKKDHPFVLDFGLARVRNEGTRITKSGSALGTPAYMPPEQAQGVTGDISERSDVYSLGATLYHVLTGRPPFDGASEYNIIWSVLTLDPIPPSSLNPRIAADLETICLKCLEKQPEKRYESAAALADDLDRFIAGEPIAARPVGSIVRLVRRARRHKLISALSVLTTILVILGCSLAWRNARQAAEFEERERQKEDERKVEDAGRQRDEAVRLKSATDRLLARVYLERSQRATADGRFSEAAILAAKALSIDDFPAYRAALLMAREGAWRRPRLLGTHQAWNVVFSPDGRQLASAGLDHLIKLWEVETGRLLATLDGCKSDVLAIAWSQDGRRIATGERDGTVRIWDARNRVQEDVPGLPAHSAGVLAVAFDKTGNIVASAGADRELHIADLVNQTGKTMRGNAEHRDWFNRMKDLAFSPDGKWLAGAGIDENTVWVFDVATWDLEKMTAFHRHLQSVVGVAWSPDSQRLTSVSRDGVIHYWELEHQRVVNTCGTPEKPETFFSCAFSKDARRAAIGYTNGTIRVWDVAIGRTIATLTLYDSGVQAVAFGPDGRTLVAESADGKLRVFDLEAGEDRVRTIDVESKIEELAISPRDGAIAATYFRGRTRIFDRETGKVRSTLGDEDEATHAVSYSPDGTRIATSGHEHTISVWDGATGKRQVELTGHDDSVIATTFSPDGRTIASSSTDETVRLWDAATGKPGAVLKPKSLYTHALRFSPDGNLLACGAGEGKLTVFKVATGEEVASFVAHADAIPSLVWSPDGKRLFTASHDHSVRIWDTESWKQVAELKGHGDAVSCVARTEDGSRLATASSDQTVRIWDSATGRELVVLPAGSSAVMNVVAFTKDGKWLVGGGTDQVLRLWPLDRVFTGPPPEEVLRECERGTGLRVLEGALDPTPFEGR